MKFQRSIAGRAIGLEGFLRICKLFRAHYYGPALTEGLPMWRLFREDDLSGQNRWDIVCTGVRVPCLIIIPHGQKCGHRWQYDTSNTKHWEKMKRHCDKATWEPLFGAFLACVDSKRACCTGNVLGGLIEGVTLKESKACAHALF